MIVVPIELAERSYDVVVGAGVTSKLPSLMPVTARRAAIVTHERIGVGSRLRIDTGLEQRIFTIGEGEQHKNLATIEMLCSGFAQWGLTRNDVVVGVGGGLVTDVAGFAAATYHRGVKVVYVSTTLLGQVDAAVGGKTAVNLPEGKNLVGAFWQPSGVICDIDHLATLPEREMKSGLGEVAKYHFIGGERLDELPLEERVAEAVRIKGAVVASDEREGGRRAILNYGHTLAHALEIAGGFDLRHGEAVAIGILYAGELAYRLGRIDEAALAEHYRVVQAYGLRDSLPADTDIDKLIELFARDKKALTGVTFVLDGPNGVEPVTDVDRTVMVDALEALL